MDDTLGVIERCNKIFVKNCIPFSSNSFENNQGFDTNVFACYTKSNSDYVWILSDDDNIITGSIDVIIKDINKYHPSVIFYNNDQKPYSTSMPYIKQYKFYDEITSNNAVALKKIVDWPKLSSLVLQVFCEGLQIVNLNNGFMHIALALHCSFQKGRVLHASTFTNRPDVDYMNHIDFTPYIFNGLNIYIKSILNATNQMYLYEILAYPYIDPLASSLNTLGDYYCGRCALTIHLKQELLTTVYREINHGWLRRLTSWMAVKMMFKFLFCIFYYFTIKPTKNNR